MRKTSMNALMRAVIGAVLAAVLMPSAQAQGPGWSTTGPPNLVTLDPGRRNPIFYVGQPISFIASGGTVSSWQVRDYWGNLVDQGGITTVPSLPGTQFIVPKAEPPGWYKVYVHGAVTTPPFGDIVGGTTFTVFRNTPGFPTLPSKGVPGGSDSSMDEPIRGLTGMGPQRLFVVDASQPAAEIKRLTGDIALDKYYYLPYDPLRKRVLFVAFSNGTSNLAGVRQIVAAFQNVVTYWEPRNEPDQTTDGASFAINEMMPFYQTVKSVNPNLKVLGPGTTSIGPAGGELSWIQNFLNAGGGKYIDAFSFHAYNAVNGDLSLARTALDALTALLTQYGLGGIEKWQTEQGYFAAMYGAYQPRHQGRWTMLQMMVYEQYGIPKEHNHLWYDKSHGYWDFPTWWENDDGSLNPAASLMRVWAEELYGTNFNQAYNFGNPGNKLYIGSLFTGPGKQVAAFMSAGSTDGKVTLNVSSGSSIHVVSAFGVAQDLPVTAGQVVLPIPEIPVYVELASGQTITPAVTNWGPDLALQPGVTATASGDGLYPLDSLLGAVVPNSITKLINGQLENWYYTQAIGAHPWMDDTPGFPSWVTVQLPAPTQIARVVVYAPIPWQWDGTPIDYQVQVNENGQWVTVDQVQEPTSTYPVFTPVTRTWVDSFFSDRCIFTHQFTPVTTSQIRLLVSDVTWGGGATIDVVNAGGQCGLDYLNLREIEIYGQ